MTACYPLLVTDIVTQADRLYVAHGTKLEKTCSYPFITTKQGYFVRVMTATAVLIVLTQGASEHT